jgi:hypothetical protein
VSSISSICCMQPCGQFHFLEFPNSSMLLKLIILVIISHRYTTKITYLCSIRFLNIISSIVVFYSYGLFHVWWYASFTKYNLFMHKYNSIVLKIPIQPFDLKKKSMVAFHPTMDDFILVMDFIHKQF